MTFVEVWAKITKSMLQNASNNSLFGATILFYLPRPPRMSFQPTRAVSKAAPVPKAQGLPRRTPTPPVSTPISVEEAQPPFVV